MNQLSIGIPLESWSKKNKRQHMTWLNLPRNVTCEMTFWGKKLPSSSLLMHNQSLYEKSLLQWLPQWLCMNHCKNFHIKAEADPAVEVLLRWEALPKPYDPTTRTGWALAALCANEGKPTRLLAFRLSEALQPACFSSVTHGATRLEQSKSQSATL